MSYVINDEEIIAIRDECLPSQGEQFDCIAFARKILAESKDALASRLIERDSKWKIIAAWGGVVGRDGIKADMYYTLRNGAPVEAA
jgi:hypothetical protein